MSYNGTTFEVRIEAGIRPAPGQVYANFYSIDPATNLPPPVTVGFLPPENGTGRGQGSISYVIKPKTGLTEGTEIRNVANIKFDYQPTIATNQVDPHDPSKGTDPNKECSNTIAPETVNLTVTSPTGGAINAPGPGTYTYGWGTVVQLRATPAQGYRFVKWSGSSDTIADVNAASTSLTMYGNFSVSAVFASETPAIIHVDHYASGANNGNSWANAFTSLKNALNVAKYGDEVWVAEGVYTPGNTRTDAFSLKLGVAVYGGFAGTEQSRDQRNWLGNATVLSGDIGIEGNSSDNCYHVFYHTAELDLDETAVLDGFTISGGNANGTGDQLKGGGMYNSGSSPKIVNCVFTGNLALLGAGMYNDAGSSPDISNTVFRGNLASGTGSAGGAIYNNAASIPLVANCTIHGNSAGTGGGIYNKSSNPRIVNSILWANTAAVSPQMHSDSSTPFVYYCNIDQDGFSGANGNMRSDPLFVDAAVGDFHLREVSPCIDAGDPIEKLTADYDGGLYVTVDSVTGIMPGDEIYITGGIRTEQGLVIATSATELTLLNEFANLYRVADGAYVFTRFSDYYDEPLPNGSRINIGAYGGTEEATSRTRCEGDFNSDRDIDGSDLAAYIMGNLNINISFFGADFGRTDCPGF